MLLSSCVIWRHLDFDEFRAECSGGDEALQRLIWERLDDALAWLVSLGAQPVWEDTENPRTTGKRFDPRALTQLLARDVELETPLPDDVDGPTVLATGGWGKKLAEEDGLLLRANQWSDGAGLAYATARNADISRGERHEFYGRAMPAPPARVREEDFVSLSQLYGTWARVYTEDGRDITPSSVAWHENDLAQRIGPRAWFVLDDAGLAHAQERVDAARAAGGTVIEPAGLPFDTPPGSRIAVHVAGAVTHTISGLRIDTRARVLDQRGRADRRSSRGRCGRRRGRGRWLRERPRAGSRAWAHRCRSARPLGRSRFTCATFTAMSLDDVTRQGPADLAAARTFLLRNARLLDRHRFAFRFEAGRAADAVTALRPYQNADGGFGHALEPDLRGAESEPVPLEHALHILDEVGDFDAQIVQRACDWLDTVTTESGGIPFVLPAVADTPHAPWWVATGEASLNPTAGIAGLLHKHNVRHPWLSAATTYCSGCAVEERERSRAR